MKIVFVTKNKNKVDDALKILSDVEIDNIDFEVPEIQSMNPEEIIENKLRFAYKKIGQPCFVMDASLFLDCLNGFPGPFIKFYFEQTVGAEKTCEIANLFKEYGCKWVSTLGYFDGKEMYFFVEEVNGRVPTKPRGNQGYHWDVIFVPEGSDKTLAEMTFEEKQEYAPTKKLLNKFKLLLDKVDNI